MIKRFAFALAALAVAGAAYSANYLHLRTADGWEVLNLDEVDHLIFKDGKMNAHAADGNVVSSYAQDDLVTSYVNQETGVESVVADAEAQSFSFNGNTAKVLANGDFTVYALGGEAVVAIPGVKAGETVALGQLEPGVYVLTLGKYSQKCVIR